MAIATRSLLSTPQEVADKWLGEVAEVLEEAGVADETLVVVVGDHGISLAEDGGVTPYDNPHVANFHVPLVFSHQKLPQMSMDSHVTSMQIMPTIMDLLHGVWLLKREPVQGCTRSPSSVERPIYDSCRVALLQCRNRSARAAATQQSFKLGPLLCQVSRDHDEEAVEWVKEAAQVTKWWVGENWLRYESDAKIEAES
ncbi:uncharacterized protein N7469_003246 [Penicillium citrinum]|uniref:Sulfatase N-terminal domain-containing protein n=1 Tax=Penicillium citrinum TaxID=5077 RepID=A0A9W9PBY9_PENCI|nr:uncharacterized protein N7469_003246 [Penicillium citrinum]KAJ5241655.1 hypothetical protein N7469_003246 [Penicillium citrinum]